MWDKILKWYVSYKIHLIAWFVYMIYESVIAGIVFDNFGNPIIYILHYIVFIVFFYIHADYALPWALKSQTRAYYGIPLVVIIQIPIYICFQFLVSYFLEFVQIAKKEVILDLHAILRNVYRSILYLLFSTGYYFFKTYLWERKKTEELERQKLIAIIDQQKTEQELVHAHNAFLKAQINPHFLFNTLDFVYHNVSVHSAVAGEAIIRLSEMMRFAMQSDQMDSQIILADEIEQVENLLYLQEIRKNEELNVEFIYSSTVQQLQFIPLVLLTLVENIFKHGDLSNPESKAIIAITINGENLCLQTSNLINDIQNSIGNRSGLKNIQKRLVYTYSDSVQFSYQAIGQRFVVKIEIPTALLTLHV